MSHYHKERVSELQAQLDSIVHAMRKHAMVTIDGDTVPVHDVQFTPTTDGRAMIYITLAGYRFSSGLCPNCATMNIEQIDRTIKTVGKKHGIALVAWCCEDCGETWLTELDWAN